MFEIYSNAQIKEAFNRPEYKVSFTPNRCIVERGLKGKRTIIATLHPTDKVSGEDRYMVDSADKEFYRRIPYTYDNTEKQKSAENQLDKIFKPDTSQEKKEVKTKFLDIPEISKNVIYEIQLYDGNRYRDYKKFIEDINQDITVTDRGNIRVGPKLVGDIDKISGKVTVFDPQLTTGYTKSEKQNILKIMEKTDEFQRELFT
jgi:hypothetical protein